MDKLLIFSNYSWLVMCSAVPSPLSPSPNTNKSIVTGVKTQHIKAGSEQADKAQNAPEKP